MTLATRYGTLAVVSIFLAAYNPFVEIASIYNQEVFLQGAAIYGSLRLLSSVMSIARDADFQGSVIFVSISASPGQALQPVIALVERMADLVFALVVVSGVLKLTLPIVASLGALTLTGGSVAKGAALILNRPLIGLSDRLARSLISMGLVATLFVPLAYSAAFVLAERFTDEAWDTAAKVIDGQANELTALAKDAGVKNSSVESPSRPTAKAADESNVLGWAHEQLEDVIRGSADKVIATGELASELGAQVSDSVKVVLNSLAMAGNLFDASVTIGVTYIVKIIVLPLIILTGLIWMFRAISRGR